MEEQGDVPDRGPLELYANRTHIVVLFINVVGYLVMSDDKSGRSDVVTVHPNERYSCWRLSEGLLEFGLQCTGKGTKPNIRALPSGFRFCYF